MASGSNGSGNGSSSSRKDRKQNTSGAGKPTGQQKSALKPDGSFLKKGKDGRDVLKGMK